MKNKHFIRLFTLLLTLAFFIPQFAQSAQALSGDILLPGQNNNSLDENLSDSLNFESAVSNSVNDIGGEADNSVFFMLFTDGTEDNSILMHAFYMEDTQGDGSTYLVTSYLTAVLVDGGFTPEVIGVDYKETASYITTVGCYAFFEAPGLEAFTPLKTGTDFTDTVYTAYYTTDNEGKATLQYYTIDMSEAEKYDGSFFYFPELKINDRLVGAPVFDSREGGLIGCLDIYNNDYELGITSIIGLEFPTEAAIVKGSAQPAGGTAPETNPQAEPETQPQAEPETQPQAEPETQPQAAQEQDDDGGKTGTTSVSILAVVAVIAAVWFVMTRKNSGKKEKEGTTAAEQRTISLEPQPEPGPVPVPTPDSAAKFQVRGVGGVMNGRVFPLNNVLRFGRGRQCSVLFPQDAPGISSLHCTLTMEDGRAVLRDENSSYGTYLGKNVRMEPRVSYNLQVGDVFTLAEGGQSFRLENAGANVQELTPAVRAVDSGKVYRADLQGRIAFGRDPRCQVAFDASDSSISANHCVLYREGNALYLMDNGSTNGTFFGEKERLRPNKPYRVSRGQAFFLCSPQYTFVILED